MASKFVSKLSKKEEFVNWFRKTLKENDEILRVFKKGAGYYVYGQETEFIADEFFKTRASIGTFKGDDSDEKDALPQIHLNEPMYKKVVIHYIQRKKNCVHLYVYEDNEWVIEQKLSVTNTSIGSLSEASFDLMAVILEIKDQTKKIGVALCNHTNFQFEISEFIENANYSKLTSLFTAKGCKQVLFRCNSRSNRNEIEKFKEVAARCNVQMVETEDTFWKSFMRSSENEIRSNVGNIIDRRSKKRLMAIDERYNKSLVALYGIILHEALNQDNANFNRYKLNLHNVDSFMNLDASAFKALDLFPSMKDTLSTSKNSNNSLYGILNKCKSAMGDRLLSVWIRQPLVDIGDIYRRQKLVKLFVENTECREILRDDQLKQLVDLEKINNKLRANGDKCKCKDLVDLYYFAESIQWIKGTLNGVEAVDFDDCDYDIDSDEDDDIKIDSKNENENSPLNVLKREFIEPMEKMESDFNNYLSMIEIVIDLVAVSQRKYLVKHTYDELLAKLDRKIKKTNNEMQKLRKAAVDKLGFSAKQAEKLTLEKHKTYGWCYKVTKALAPKVKKHSAFNVLRSQMHRTYFIDSRGNKLRSLAKTLDDLEKKYDERQALILSKCIEIAKTYISVIDEAIKIFSELDVLLSLAHIAACSVNTYCLPKIKASSKHNKFIKMKNARHPCLELIQLDDVGGVIPNDVEMESNKSSFQVITGPNMGGKSTYIRMIGLVVLMAQIGSYVPCDECSLTVIDSILARVGAGDNQLKGVSTFMQEMLETSSILEQATQNSLIIIDELGRGTSTYDGYGIASSISEHIITSLNSFCLFATHFHELSALSTKYECCQNKHVTAHFEEETDSLTMLYKIHKGPCPQSFGIEVAKMAKFPDKVIQMAKEKAHHLENKNKKISKFSMLTRNQINNILKEYERMKKENVDEAAVKNLKSMIYAAMEENKQLEEIAVKNRNKGNQRMDID